MSEEIYGRLAQAVIDGEPEDAEEVGSVVSLSNHPNPFGGSTSITYTLAGPSQVTLAVYDIAGHMVRTLESGARVAGEHEIRWDGMNDAGRRVANGTYFLRLETGEQVTARKMNLVR